MVLHDNEDIPDSLQLGAVVSRLFPDHLSRVCILDVSFFVVNRPAIIA